MDSDHESNPDSKPGLETRFTPGVHLAAGVTVAMAVAEAVEIMMSVDVAVTYVVEGVMLKQEHALDSCDGAYVAAQARKLVLAALFTTSGSVVVR